MGQRLSAGNPVSHPSGEFGGRGMSFNIRRGPLGNLAMFAMIHTIGSVRSTSSAISLFFCA